MTTEPKDRIVERIRRCLALGDSKRNPNEHEAETAIRMAKNLMAEYNLSLADVVSSDGMVQGKIVEQEMRKRAAPPLWETSLSQVCNYLFSVYSFTNITYERTDHSRLPQERRSVVFIGYETDVALAAEVYKLLKLELLSMGLRWQKKEETRFAKERSVDAQQLGSGMTPMEWRTRRFKYTEGIVWTLVARAKKEADNLTEEQARKVTALVLQKKSDAKEWAYKQHPDLRPVHRRETGLHHDAMRQGLADGQGVSLSFKDKMHPGKSQGGLLE